MSRKQPAEPVKRRAPKRSKNPPPVPTGLGVVTPRDRPGRPALPEPPPGVIRTAGAYDRNSWPTYFVASSTGRLMGAAPFHHHVLIAVNEIEGESAWRDLRTLIDQGNAVFLDSGVFNLSTQHAKRHGITMDEALSTAPADIDGFHELYEKYIALMREFGDRLWGYIEIDQGGRENKIKTRAKLEAEGLRPIPVYHPFNDGWDYFDYLCSRYDRICFGNVVQANTIVRKRLLATMWERRRKHPHVWIHMLGLTPSELTAAYPPSSCDSSTWLSGIRWGVHMTQTANKSLGSTGKGFCYVIGEDVPPGRHHMKACMLAGYDAHIQAETMRAIREEQEVALGADVGGFSLP